MLSGMGEYVLNDEIIKTMLHREGKMYDWRI